jgi:hypothetical protein
MSLFKAGILALLLQARGAVGAVVAVTPTITLDSGTFIGKVGSVNTQSFLGIPFGQPP